MVLKTNLLLFFVLRTFTTPIEESRAVLPEYVRGINAVLSKNTTRRVEFGGINYTNEILDSEWHFPQDTKADDYTITVLIKEDSQTGGGAAIRRDGGGLVWLKTPRLIKPDDSEAYWQQIFVLLHELGHVWGCGLSEFYSLVNVRDTTGVEPIRNIDGRVVYPFWPNKHKNYFWDKRMDWYFDPMNVSGWGILFFNRDGALRETEFSALNAKIISGNYRISQYPPPLPDLSRVPIVVKDVAGEPINNAKILVFGLSTGNNQYSYEIFRSTENPGAVFFPWRRGMTNSSDIIPGENLRIIKVFKEGYEPFVEWLSLFDAQEAALFGRWFGVEARMAPGRIPKLEIGGGRLLLHDAVDGQTYILHSSTNLVSWSQKQFRYNILSNWFLLNKDREFFLLQ